ncbi:MAG: PIG-L family deacetylase [Blastocatellia bacterium]|nr:PIG-L family deacetylase [Blastocatellia bacterium]MCS7157889.1 PIG-L family deacetylase [Blastocatellia bacterium]MCX7753374.1 PIG-L family deacetylase [Blastocatellia bacterium]MDW8168033.1 PIG-L family deacetylase [Acidobacteriota bacterium]MDW8255773.1 PIG-L family deacetylase [Acidobacteriota bacterium]
MPRRSASLRACCGFLLLFLFGAALRAGWGTPQPISTWEADESWTEVVPKPSVDSGLPGLVQALRKLRTTARLLHVTAHPDDEDGAMLTLVARGLGAEVMLLTLTRGEGGQNKIGPELLDALGLVRTLELLAADAHYGVRQRFTRVADFGFSKTAEETLRKWDGGEPALADLVRVIRSFRPDVVVARFHGAPRDGHGNHQVAGILAREAFEVAGDPTRFPEHIREGLSPWSPKKLYVSVRADEAHTVRLNTGAYDPALGQSYAQLAMKGLSLQLTQGVGGVIVPPGDRYVHYRLIASRVPTAEREEHFFDGLDTSLPGLAARLGAEERALPFLRSMLREVDQHLAEAQMALSLEHPERAARPLLRGLAVLTDLIARIERAPLSPAMREDLLLHLRTKRMQLSHAINLALGLVMEARVDASATTGDRGDEPMGFARSREPFVAVSPGQTFTVTARLWNRGRAAVIAEDLACEAPKSFTVVTLRRDLKSLGSNESAFLQCRITIPPDLDRIAWTRPYWRREDPHREAILRLDVPDYATLPLPPLPVRVRAHYTLEGMRSEIATVVRARSVDPIYGEEDRPLLIGPPLSVQVHPESVVMRASSPETIPVTVSVRSHVPGEARVTLRLATPSGWRVEPAAQSLSFSRQGETQNVTFQITPGNVREGHYDVTAIAEYQGRSYTEGYTLVGRREIGWFPFFQPARVRIHVVDVVVPSTGLRVGYIMGAGDEIPRVLAQLGLTVEVLAPGQLAREDLSRFQVIVLGIRAYDVREDVREHNRRLLDFVERGGTLLVQYNQDIAIFNGGNFTPYPATLGRGRVSVEDAPVEILLPEDRLFHWPNRITERDFQGWVQERGLYFMERWDERFTPLLASHDPGEPPLQGGLLRARYGRGTYLFTGYAFFRQLPAGVPGAIRLFVNLLYAGREGR